MTHFIVFTRFFLSVFLTPGKTLESRGKRTHFKVPSTRDFRSIELPDEIFDQNQFKSVSGKKTGCL